MTPNELPRVAILGRPNVGKSTLFNRIVGGRRALVDGRPGVTRDRIEAAAEWAGRRFVLIDTGGFEASSDLGLPEKIRTQSLRAAAEADVVLFVVDGRAGLAPPDRETARLLARLGRPVFLVVNKIDSEAAEPLAAEFFALGLGDPWPVSAEHGRRVHELLDAVVARLPLRVLPGEKPADLRLAVIGRPNVGKSSLVNRLLGEERVLVDAAAGTTRDAVDAEFEAGGRRFVLVDTAGIRRRSRIDDRLERASVGRALAAVERADVALLVVDAAEGLTEQDARLARQVWERGRGLLLVANKWDLVPAERADRHAWLAAARRRFPHLEDVPAVFVSALSGSGIETLLPAVSRVEAAFRSQLGTRGLNRVLQEATSRVEPPAVRGRRGRVYYATATAACPPVVTLFVNDPQRFPAAYLRYLEHRIREAFFLEGTPLRLELRPRPRRAGRPAAGAETASRPDAAGRAAAPRSRTAVSPSDFRERP
jgi:GTP-binding protein